MKAPKTILCGLALAAILLAGCGTMSDMTFAEPAQNTEFACNPSNSSLQSDKGAVLNVEVVDRNGPFDDSEVVTVSDMSGMALVSLECPHAWVQFVLTPGTYRVSASLGELQSNDAIVVLRPEGAHVTLTMAPEPNADFYAPDIVL